MCICALCVRVKKKKKKAPATHQLFRSQIISFVKEIQEYLIKMDEYFQLGIVNQMANKIPKAKNSFIINSQRSTCCFVFFPYSSEPAISTKSLSKS